MTAAPNTNTGKVFGIGLSRTGAQTLNDSLELLGYRSHFVVVHDDFESLLPLYDAFTHFPLVEKYVELDRRFPGSKFILTVREQEDWLRSVEYRLSLSVGNTAPATLGLMKRVYGSETFDRDLFSAAYDRYHNEVKQYFEGREGALLLLNLCGGEGFEKLCPFLGKSIPDESFPHSKKNSRAHLNKPIQRLKRFLVKLFRAGQIKRAILNIFGRR